MNQWRAPLTTAEVRRIRHLRYVECLPREEVAHRVGVKPSTVTKYAPTGPLGKVPVAPLREAFLRSGLGAQEVARRVGWWATPTRPDGSRVRRTLGLTVDRPGRSTRTLVDTEIVEALADAIGVPPWEVMPDDEGEPLEKAA